jgi:hypothetical protein
MADAQTPEINAFIVAARVGTALNSAGLDYAIGGALALGYWSEPRGTNDVDVTIYVDPDLPDDCYEPLRAAGGEFRNSEALVSIREHGFFRLTVDGIRVDVFLPTIPVHQLCRSKRQQVVMEGEPVFVWSAEALAVFKMMFFRPRDLLDVESMLQDQGDALGTKWVREQLVDIFGQRDPRVTTWDEIVARTRG